MAITGVSKVAFPGTMSADELDFDNLIAQMIGDDVYISEGELSEAEIGELTSVAAYDSALESLFDVLGELSEDAAKADSKLDALRTRNYKVAAKRTNELTINLVGISQPQKKYLESPAFSETTMTMVLRNREKDRTIIFNGMKWTMDWNAEVDGLYQVVLSTEFTGTTDKKIYMFKDLPATG